ncbi:MAG: hypothetical protein IIX75_00530 [Clostridia bacterium]|nr:hypothetical protein [Clostridia bacterium]
MNENSCSEILDKALSERHIEEASNAEAFFKSRKAAALRKSRILKSVSAFAACIALVLSLGIAAMFINPDKKSDQFAEDAPNYSENDFAADDDIKGDSDPSDGNYGDEGDFDGENEGETGLTGVYAIDIGNFEENIEDSLVHDILSLEAKGNLTTLTSKQKETFKKQLKVYLKEFCAANSLSEEYTFEISPTGKEYGTHIFARVVVTFKETQTIELLVVVAK